MLDHLTSMAVFARVVDEKGFSAAARGLNMSKSAVSKHVGRLEDRLGARLLNRTTRRLSLTEVGRVYYEHCARILHEAEEGDLAVGRLQEEPRGTLRINAPMSFGQVHIAPALPDFLTAYPDLSVDVTFDDRFVDAVEEGYDVLIRIGWLSDSSLIARKLAWSEAQICASPAYWEKHGMPSHPRDLLEHNCLNYTYLSTNNEWRFINKDEPGEITSVRVNGNIRANNSPVQREAALAGVGVARLPHFVVCDDIRAGRLVPALTDYPLQPFGIHAVYPHNRHLSAKVRAFVDFFADRLKALRDENGRL